MTSVHFSWLDAIDIFLVTILIYSIIQYVRGTRMSTALGGLFVLLVVYVLAQVIGLYSLVWIFENVFSSIFLVVVILFSDDIRSALATISIRSFFSKETEYSEEFVQILSSAVFEMSRKNVGALIVLERSESLNEISSKGIIIDAALSQELLTTIFSPKTALHDGAVIIDRNGKVKAAACILPLAESVKNSEFGTRHRAALGLSEESDALIIVVSEERGQVRLVHQPLTASPINGAISKVLKQEEFVQELKHVLK